MKQLPVIIKVTPTLFMMGVIFFLSSLSGDEFKVPLFPGFDKLAHAGIYGLLTLSYLFVLNRDFRKHRPIYALFTVWIMAVCYGISDEIHQYFVPGRTPDIYDILADGFGAFLAALFWYFGRFYGIPFH